MDKTGIERPDNYKMTIEKWKSIFVNMDHKELSQRFGLKYDEQWLYITYYGQDYRIERSSGKIENTNAPQCNLDFNTYMAIFNLFYYSKKGAAVRGKFVPFRDVKGAAPFDPAFQKSIVDGLARPFNGKAELLKNACIALGGEPVATGDVGYVIKAFDFMPVMLVFWDGDDEFESQANLLFDADITDFIHEETVCCIAGTLMQRLKEIARI